ncbi:hypothetical protein FOFC_18279, partial [Fusarium oxysporum]
KSNFAGSISTRSQHRCVTNAAAALKLFTDSSTSPHYWHRLRDSNLRPCNRCCYASLPSRSLCSQPRHKRPTSASAC